MSDVVSEAAGHLETSSPSDPSGQRACPLCGGRLAPWLSMPIDPKKEASCAFGEIYRCPSCSFGMVLPRPKAEELGDFYVLEQYYTHGRSHFADGGTPSFLDRVRTHLAWRLDRGEWLTAEMVHGLIGGRRATICDVGCGHGLLAAKLSQMGHDVMGVEIDTLAAVEARRAGVELHDGSIESLPEAAASRRFDLVILSHVLEHVLDPVRAVSTVGGMLKPGGLLVCAVPNNASAGLADAGPAWEPLDVPRHLNFFVPENLKTITERVGLRPSRLFYSGYARQFANDWINTERRIHDAITRHGGHHTPSAKNSRLRAWWLLARTVLAPPSRKYDSVGIIAEKP